MTIFQRLSNPLFFLVLFSIFLLPSFKIIESFPSIRIDDALLPFILFYIVINKKVFVNNYIRIVFLFITCITISIVLNDRLGFYRDYFEIFKIIKFCIYIFFFSSLSWEKRNIYTFFKYVFIILCIFNIAHYFNIFSFNDVIEIYYSPQHHLIYHGIDSDGNKATIRLLGTMGNPNNNAILFLFFVIFFMPKSESDPKEMKFFYFLAILGSLHSQSRTAFIVLAILFTIHLVYKFSLFKRNYLAFSCFFLLLFADFVYGDLAYLNSLRESEVTFNDSFNESNSEINKVNNKKNKAFLLKTNNTSLNGRFEIWQHLITMIKQKPLFGHGPDKEYFYQKGLYAENEYILITWRYGFVGLFFFLTMIASPLVLSFKFIKRDEYFQLFLFIIVITITAFTNSPLSEPSLVLLFAIFIGRLFSRINVEKKNEKETVANIE